MAEKTAYEQLDEYQQKSVDNEAKRRLEQQPKDPVPLNKLKARTTKQLTHDLAMFNLRLRNLEDMIKWINGRLENIDAAAYMAVTSLERKGQLKSIDKMNRKLQVKVATKIQATRDTITAYEDELLELEQKAVEEQMEQMKKQQETEATNGEENTEA